MAEIVADKLEVCTDCTLLFANGEVTDSSGADIGAEIAARIAEHCGTEFALCSLVNACEPDCDGWFSHSPCETCGSPLAGDRHYAAAIR